MPNPVIVFEATFKEVPSVFTFTEVTVPPPTAAVNCDIFTYLTLLSVASLIIILSPAATVIGVVTPSAAANITLSVPQ